ncbi:MAG: protein phosphatase 2C domain-containing protein [Reichenbachiella sp.]
MTIKITSQTHVGKVRKNNEDSFFSAELNNKPAHYIALVSDGVGGKEFGEVASQTTVDVFSELVSKGKLDIAVDINIREAMLEMSTRRAHMAIAEKGKVDKSLSGMSCTLVAVLIDKTTVGFVNVGDSRLYYYSEGELFQISEDQTVARALLQDGRIQAADLPDHPDRNVLQHALGVEAVNHPIEPQTSTFTWQQGDKLILCSDGLTDMLSDTEITATMSKFNGDALVEQLVNQALAAGGRDNITIVLCENEISES